MNFLKWIYGTIIIFFLSGCQEEKSYSYFLKNPKELQSAYDQCEKEEKPTCQAVQRAMRDYLVLLNSQNQDPEAFGQKILKTQQNLVQFQKNYEKAQHENDKNLLKLTYDAYADEKEQLQIYYAVVSKMIAD